MYHNDKERVENFKRKIKKINSRIGGKDSKKRYFKAIKLLRYEIEETLLQLEDVEILINEFENDELNNDSSLKNNYENKKCELIEILYDFDEQVKKGVFSLKEKILKKHQENE